MRQCFLQLKTSLTTHITVFAPYLPSGTLPLAYTHTAVKMHSVSTVVIGSGHEFGGLRRNYINMKTGDAEKG